MIVFVEESVVQENPGYAKGYAFQSNGGQNPVSLKADFFLFVYKTQKTHTYYQAVMRFLLLSRHGDSNPGPFHYE